MILERRPIHIHLTKDVFLNFKLKCADDRISMQDVVEFFVNGIIDERKEMIDLYSELVELKKNRKMNKVSRVDADSLFNKILGEIEDETPR